MIVLPNAVVIRFNELLERARDTNLREPTAMTLATCGSDGRVSARVVLLRSFDKRGFAFFTNLASDKSQQLDSNTAAAICFHWDAIAEQVRVEGTAERISDDEADAYWKTRARGSQIGAWASRQSETLDKRETLEKRVSDFEVKFRDQDVPRPEFWSGYRIRPNRVEFWTNRESRLHERLVYESCDGEWATRMLFP